MNKKRWIGLVLFLVLFFVSMVTPARAETRLTGFQKQEDGIRTRLIFVLSETAPGFRVDASGQRVDLIIEQTVAVENLKFPPEDGHLVRMTLLRRQQELVVSMLMRRAPLRVATETLENPPRILMDIHWQKEDAARPAIGFRISDMPPRRPGSAASRFRQESPWDGRWSDFFKDYRSEWTVNLPQSLTPPPPPPNPITDEHSPLMPLQQFADQGLYLSLLQQAVQLPALADDHHYQRDLMMADAYLRTGSYAAGLARLRGLRPATTEQRRHVDYLTAWGEAAADNAIGALLQLQTAFAESDSPNPPAPAVQLLYAEAALAAGQYRIALERLSDETVFWPEDLALPRSIRLADARAGLGETEAALVRYRELAQQERFCAFYHASCNRAAHAAFKVADYEFARHLYRRLALEYGNRPGSDLIHFAAGAAAYEAGDFDWGWIGLEQTAQDFKASEGGERAELRLIDIRIINGSQVDMRDAVARYADLAGRSRARQLREESAFKEALALFLLEDYQPSVARLMSFRRDFAASGLRREADLLLARQLPLVVELLLDQGDDLQAVVLVEQNRDLLLAGGYDRRFLRNLALAFDRLGLYERSARVLLYLLDRTAGTPEQEGIYLPLARSFMQRDEFAQAGDYARQYFARFPDGEDAGAMFVLLLDALERQNLEEEMMQLLQSADRPDLPEAHLRAAAIYWKQDNFAAVVSSLERAAARRSLNGQDALRLAEAYYRTDKMTAALRSFDPLLEVPEFRSQARYRSAQILLRQGQRGAALEQLESLLKEDGNSSWGKLARDLLIHEQRRRS